MSFHKIFLSDSPDIERLRVLSSLGRPARGRIILSLPFLDDAEAQSWAKRLERVVFACGCAEGTIVGVVALVGFFAWRFLSVSHGDGFRWIDIPLALLVLIAGTSIGKAGGMVGARRTLHRLKHELRTLSESAESN